MRRFRLFISVVLLLLPSVTFGTPTEAENGVPQFQKKFFPEMRQKNPDWAKQLKLSDEQETKLEAIYDESRPQIQAIMQQIETLHQQMQNIRQADEQKLRAILTEKQIEKFEKIQERMAKHQRQPQPRDKRRQRFKMPEK